MSDLAESSALSLTSPQLPVSWYFDPAIYTLELEHLFRRGSGYVGHQLMAPESGVRSPAEFHALLIAEHVSVLSQTPSAFYALQTAAALQPELGRDVRPHA